MAQKRVFLHARSSGVQMNPYDTILTSTDPIIYVVDGRKVRVARVRSLPPPPPPPPPPPVPISLGRQERLGRPRSRVLGKAGRL